MRVDKYTVDTYCCPTCRMEVIYMDKKVHTCLPRDEEVVQPATITCEHCEKEPAEPGDFLCMDCIRLMLEDMAQEG